MRKTPLRVKLISGLLSADIALLAKTKKVLEKYYGLIDRESPLIPFDFTDYYNKELGVGIWRQYVSFVKLIEPDRLAKIKCVAIKIEAGFRVEGQRKVNIDPGYLALDKLVLATTKDATYRIYLGKKIFAQSMLFFQNKSFNAWSWTYPDYRSETAITFFNKVRGDYQVVLK